MVPSVQRVCPRTIAATSAGTAAGLAAGYLANHLLIGGAVGLVAGLAGAAAIHLKQCANREQRKDDLVKRQAETKQQMLKDYAVPQEPTATFAKAQVYASDKNLVVEFPETGYLVGVTNTGPKRSVMWVTEGSGLAYGAAGESLGRMNEGIEQTEAEYISPGMYEPRSIHGGSDIKRYDPLGSKDLQVQLDEAGHLGFSHSGCPDGGAVYDLNTGNLESPYLSIKDGVVQKIKLDGYTPAGTAYAYDKGTFIPVGSDQGGITPTLPLSAFGDEAVRFPAIEGANGTRLDTGFSIKNEGVFQSAEKVTTIRTNYIPPGAEWTPDPQEKRVQEDLAIDFTGGARLQQTSTFESYEGSHKLTINGIEKHGLVASGSETGVTIHQPRFPSMYQTDKNYTQTIAKDGTITWRGYYPEFWTTYTFKPDGEVTGVSGHTSYSGENFEREYTGEMPKLLPDGTVQLGGYTEKLFVSPQEIGWGAPAV